jgi:hypothetical protein
MVESFRSGEANPAAASAQAGAVALKLVDLLH